MDSKLALLKEFYAGLPKDRAKVETHAYGFPFLEGLLTEGVILEYGEMHRSGLLHKYKLSHLSQPKMDELLGWHVEKKCNLCLYFDDQANNLFCFNLDNNHKTNNTTVIPEMELAVSLLRAILLAHGCTPLIIASGRGYHVWGQLAVAVENSQLYTFMLQAMAKTMAGLDAKGLDYNQVKANFYPDPRTRDTVSLRLFGSEHAKNKVFSHVFTQDGLLDEGASWNALEHHLRHHIISKENFDKACDVMAQSFISQS